MGIARAFAVVSWLSPLDFLYQLFVPIADISLALLGSSCGSLLNSCCGSASRAAPLMGSVCCEDLVRGIEDHTEVGTLLLFMKA